MSHRFLGDKDAAGQGPHSEPPLWAPAPTQQIWHHMPRASGRLWSNQAQVMALYKHTDGALDEDRSWKKSSSGRDGLDAIACGSSGKVMLSREGGG